MSLEMNQDFENFVKEVQRSVPAMEYVWSKEKEASCQWIIDRIPSGKTGVDVGGTQYLCDRLKEKVVT